MPKIFKLRFDRFHKIINFIFQLVFPTKFYSYQRSNVKNIFYFVATFENYKILAKSATFVARVWAAPSSAIKWNENNGRV